MSFGRGDVVLAWYPFASGEGGKRRPCLVVQNDLDNARLTNTIVAQITSNLRAAHEPTHLLIEVATVEGAQSGLLHDSLISGNNLATIEQALVARTIGTLSAAMLARFEDCLKAALDMR